MRSDLEHNRAREVNHHSLLYGVEHQALVGDVTLPDESTALHFFDPNGANRVVTLPAYKRGRVFIIAHDGTDNTLTINDSNGNALIVVRAKEVAHLYCSGNEWRRLPGVFGPAGTGHSTGLVPDPGAVDGLNRFLMDDGTWTSVTTAGIVDAYKQITDGVNTAVAAGLSQFKIRSNDSTITVTVTEADATHGDNVDLVVNEAAVDHDALLNFVANEHIDHTSVSIGTAASSGLAGGGTIAASRALTLDINNLVGIVPVLADSFAFYDASGLATGKATLSALNAILDHDGLLNFSSNEHIDHTGVSIIAGSGLSGGGTIETSRTLSLAIDTLSTDTLASGDSFVFYDVSGGEHNRITFANLNTSIDHNVLANYSANQHVDHTSVTLTAGAGLTGGGDISSSRTFAVGAGTGITVNADDVALDTAHARNVDHSAVTLTAGAGLTGGGDISSSRSFAVGAGTGITVNADDVALDTAHARNVDHSAVTLTAGAGLTGGGDISSSRTFAVGAGTGITVNADDVAINFAVNATWTGTHTFQSTVDVQKECKLSGVISPAQLTSNTNDWDPTGNSTASIIRFSTDAARDITGLVGADNIVKILFNVGSNDGTLKDESASSTATNRFALSGDVVIAGDQGVMLWKDPTTSRWRLIGSVGSGSGGGAPTTSQYLTLATDGTLSAERVLTPGGGLTGTDGGAGSTYTLDVGAGTGITVNANDVALDTSSTRNTDHASVTFTAGNGLTGGGTLAANRTFDVGAGSGISVGADAVSLDINGLTTDNTIDYTVDYIPYYDGGEAANNKVLLSTLRNWHSIASGSLSGASVSITSIPQTFHRLMLVVAGMSVSAANTLMAVQVDSDNGASYDTTAGNYNGTNIVTTTLTAGDQASLLASNSGAANGFADFDAAETADFTLVIEGYQEANPISWYASDGPATRNTGWCSYGGTTPINALRLNCSTGNFDAGTYALYGA